MPSIFQRVNASGIVNFTMIAPALSVSRLGKKNAVSLRLVRAATLDKSAFLSSAGASGAGGGGGAFSSATDAPINSTGASDLKSSPSLVRASAFLGDDLIFIACLGAPSIELGYTSPRPPYPA